MSFQNEHQAVISCVGTLTAMNWRRYLDKNWTKLTEGLERVKILIMAGVHGGTDGYIGGDAENINDCRNQIVSML